jgi:hypothetical protein
LSDTAIDPETSTFVECKEPSQQSEGPLWPASNAKENGQCTQGFGDQNRMNTMFFIPFASIPKRKKPMYLQVVSASLMEKASPRCICWTFGGNGIVYATDLSTKKADLIITKILISSILCTLDAKLLGNNIKDIYLDTPTTDYKYMHIPL